MNHADHCQDNARLERNCQAQLEIRNRWLQPERTAEDKIYTALQVAKDRLEVPVAYLTHIDDGTQEIVLAHDDIGLDSVEPGRTADLSRTYCRHTVAAEPELTVLHAGRNLSRDDPAYRLYGLEFYVGVPVVVDGNLFGTVCFGDVKPRRDTFSSAEKSFSQVLALNIALVLDGMEHERYGSVLERVLRHNLRNSLTVISGHLQMIENTLGEDESIAVVREEVQDLLTLSREAKDLYDILKSDTPLETIDLVDLAERTVRRMRLSYPRAKIDVKAPETAEAVAISQIRVAVEELIENAIVHNERVEPSVFLKVSGAETAVSIRVIDDGPGIPEDELEVLRSEESVGPTNHGSGLGLWLVRLIVQQSNGQISFTDTDNGGSVVEFTLSRAGNEYR